MPVLLEQADDLLGRPHSGRYVLTAPLLELRLGTGLVLAHSHRTEQFLDLSAVEFGNVAYLVWLGNSRCRHPVNDAPLTHPHATFSLFHALCRGSTRDSLGWPRS